MAQTEKGNCRHVFMKQTSHRYQSLTKTHKIENYKSISQMDSLGKLTLKVSKCDSLYY